MSRSVVAFSLLAMASVGFAQQILCPVKGLLTGEARSVDTAFSALESGGYRLQFGKKDSFFVVHMPPGTNWTGRSHLDLRVRNNGNRIASIEVNVGSQGGEGWMSSAAVLSPGQSADLAMPLFTSEQYGIRVLPSMSDSSARQTRSLGNIFPTTVSGIYIFNKDILPADVTVESIEITNHTVPLGGFVDTFGQQSQQAWNGKVGNVADLRAQVGIEPDGTYPYSADLFGGITGGRNYGPLARFSVRKDGSKWHLVTPAGNRFFSMGINEVGAQAWTPVQGREALFSDLSSLKANFAGHFSNREGRSGFIPYGVNLQRKYGTDWRSKADSIFMKRMRSWGFNTVGMNSWDSLMSQREMPSTFGLEIWSPHSRLQSYHGRTLPDVYSQTWVDAAKKDIALRVSQVSFNHSQNIGIFIDNEMPWGIWHSNVASERYATAVAALNTPGSASHKHLLALLKRKYTSVFILNRSWGTRFSGWGELSKGQVLLPERATPGMANDFQNFMVQFAQRYFSSVRSALTEAKYGGLYLGCRFARDDYTPEILKSGRSVTDILSFNIYHEYPSRSNPSLKTLDHPIMISEFCFGAMDNGRVGMPLYPTLTEDDRSATFQRYVEEIKTWPNVVGVHWYRWEDFPATGKIDMDNMQQGLLSITDQPYSLVQQTRVSSASMMESLRLTP